VDVTHAGSLRRRRRSHGPRERRRNRNRPRPRPRCGRLNPEPSHPYGRGRRRCRRSFYLVQAVRDRSYDLGSLLDLCNRGLVSQFGHSFLGGSVLLHRQFLGRDHVDQEASTRAANRRYSSQLNRGSAQRGWSGNCWRRTTESCSRMTRSVRKSRINPEPARSSRTTSSSARSGW